MSLTDADLASEQVIKRRALERADAKQAVPRTRVVNLRRDAYDVYIGRGSKWGNPFRIGHRNEPDGHVWSRTEVINLYASWLRTDFPELIAAAKVELRGKVLGCYCAPLPCHGDVLARIADAD